MTNPLTDLERLAANTIANGDIDKPDWIDCFQSWRSYVPQEIRDKWDSLPREAKLIAVILGEQLADREKWD